MSLLDYEKRFSTLRMNTRGGKEKSPHKVAMLLAVMDLIERERISTIPNCPFSICRAMAFGITQHLDKLNLQS